MEIITPLELILEGARPMKLDSVVLRKRLGKFVLCYRGYARAHTVLFHARQNSAWATMPWRRFWKSGAWKVASVCQVCFVLNVLHGIFPTAVNRWLKLKEVKHGNPA